MIDKLHMDFIEKLPIGCVYAQTVYDIKGNIEDFIYIHSNQEFQKIFDIDKDEIQGKRLIELCKIEQIDFGVNWTEMFENKVYLEEKTDLEYYSPSNKKWYRMTFMELNRNSRVFFFSEVTRDRKLIEDIIDIKTDIDAIFETSLELVFKINSRGCIVKASSSVKEILGYLDGELEGISIVEFIHDQDIKPTLKTIGKRSRDLEFIEFKNRIKRKDGSYRRLQWRLRRQRGNFYAWAKDITDDKDIKKELELENRRLNEIIEATNTGTWEWNMIKEENVINGKWAEIIGYTLEELGPINHDRWRELIHPDDLKKNDDIINKHIRGEIDYYVSEFRIRHKNGHWVWVLERGRIISYTDNGRPELMIGTHIDISDRKEKQDEIAYLSYRDQLTGLYNRRYFEETIEKLDRIENFPISLIVVDVNGLKLINDAFGHQMGDNLIKGVADILKSNSRRDDIVARVGGDEFIIVLPKTNGRDANIISDRYYHATLESDIDDINLSISIGFSTKYREQDEIMDVYREAEKSMYNRKLKESKIVKECNLENIINKFYENSHSERRHSENVARISEHIGRTLGIRGKELEQLKLSSLFHDIGSLGINKTPYGDLFELSLTEQKEMKRHPEVGYHILKSVNELVPVAENVLHHHERWDGKGYPSALAKNSIPLYARIISIADVYDMTISTGNKTRGQVIKEIRDHSGKRFDPKIVDIFIEEAEKGNI